MRIAASGLAAALLVALALWPLSGRAQNYRTYGAEQFFAVDWEPGERRGRPVVTGHVVNNYGLAASDVRIQVESLDPSGQVTGTTIWGITGMVVPGSRYYFEVPVKERAPSYRVIVLSWTWRVPQSRLRWR